MEFISLIITYIWPVFLLFLLIGCVITYVKIKKPEATAKVAIRSAFIITTPAFLIGTFGFMIFFIDGVIFIVTAIMSLITAITLFALVWSFSIFIIRWKRPDLTSQSQLTASILIVVLFIFAISPLLFNAVAKNRAVTSTDPQIIIQLYNKAKNTSDRSVFRAISENPATPVHVLNELYENWKGPYPAYDIQIICGLGKNISSPENLLLKLVGEGAENCLLKNPMVSNKVLEEIIQKKTHGSEESLRNEAAGILETRRVAR